MDAQQFRSIQAPLKDKYRSDPASALVTLRARGKAGEGISCNVETGRKLVEAGLHPATGGAGIQVCSGDMLLEALVACLGVTLRAVATSLGIDLEQAEIETEGDIDFRGTLGISKDAPVGFKAIRVRFTLVGSISDEQRETLLRLTERYCVVLQTIRGPVPVSIA